MIHSLLKSFIKIFNSFFISCLISAFSGLIIHYLKDFIKLRSLLINFVDIYSAKLSALRIYFK